MNMTKSRFLRVNDYPDGEGTSTTMMAALLATGMVRIRGQTPVTLRMKYEMAMAPEIRITFNLETHTQHTIKELMKLYNGGVRNCVLKFPENFPNDAQAKLCYTLDETFSGLMKEVDENGKLRRLKVYFVKEIGNENNVNLASFLCVVIALLLYWLLFKVLLKSSE